MRFSLLEGKYEHVLVITVASQLSGTYQLIEQRIKEKIIRKTGFISLIHD